MKYKLKYYLLFFVFLTGCTSDLYTKHLANNYLRNNHTIAVADDFLELQYAENKGIAFSIFHQLSPNIRKPILVVFPLLTIISLGAFVCLMRKNTFFILLPYLMILSGAVGNLVNRLQYGFVIDFIYFHIGKYWSWPIFNLADIFISIGICLLFIQHFIRAERTRIPFGI